MVMAYGLRVTALVLTTSEANPGRSYDQRCRIILLGEARTDDCGFNHGRHSRPLRRRGQGHSHHGPCVHRGIGGRGRYVAIQHVAEEELRFVSIVASSHIPRSGDVPARKSLDWGS